MKDLLIGMVVGVVTGYVLRKMEDDGKLILWGTLVVLLLIMIGIINPFLLILILSIFIYAQS